MGIFKFLKKSSSDSKIKRVNAIVKSIAHPTDESIKIVFNNDSIPTDYLAFKAGQYTNIEIHINNKKEVRSYSLCSKPNEEMGIAVKSIPNGLVSNYLKNKLKVGDEITISKPEGNFCINEEDKKIICFAAGSGITPIFSIAKNIEMSNQKMLLYYGNKSIDSTIFYKEIRSLINTETEFHFSQKSPDNLNQRIDGEFVKKIIKKDLGILKSDKFLICGPENMIIEVKDALKLFGIKDEKIIYELFTTPVKMESASSIEQEEYIGDSEVEIVLDGKKHQIVIPEKGPLILDAAEKKGIEVPFSCRSGLCCSCKAKITEGNVIMKVNHALTDQEIKEGYILACQAIANSSKININFDE